MGLPYIVGIVLEIRDFVWTEFIYSFTKSTNPYHTSAVCCRLKANNMSWIRLMLFLSDQFIVFPVLSTRHPYDKRLFLMLWDIWEWTALGWGMQL